MEGCAALQRNATPPHHCCPTAKSVMLKDVAGSRSFSTASPDSVTSVTCAQCEPAFICEEHREPVANLPILVFCGKCQESCTVLGCEHNPHLWTSGTQTILMESVSNRFLQACRALMISAICLGFFGTLFAFVGMKCTRIGGADQMKAKVACLSGILFILSAHTSKQRPKLSKLSLATTCTANWKAKYIQPVQTSFNAPHDPVCLGNRCLALASP
ncbi:unnamed protein product, partial [Ranitomeya imitator]